MNHSRLAVISNCLTTINPYWFCVVHGNRPSCGGCSSEVCCGNKAGEETTSKGMARILERRLGYRMVLLRLIEAPIELGSDSELALGWKLYVTVSPG